MKWVVKTSSVRVATSGEERVYRSLEDVPPELRRKIRKTIEGPNSETIWIANQEAYERIVAQEPDIPPEMQNLRDAVTPQPAAPQPRPIPKVNRVLGVLFLAAVGLCLLWAWLIQAGR